MSVSYVDQYKDDCLPVCCAMQSSRKWMILQRCFLLHHQGDQLLSDYIVLHPRRQPYSTLFLFFSSLIKCGLAHCCSWIFNYGRCTNIRITYHSGTQLFLTATPYFNNFFWVTPFCFTEFYHLSLSCWLILSSK